GLLVAGWGAAVAPATAARFAVAAGWPVLADPISQLRVPPFAISTYEALLRAPGFAAEHRPDLVVRVGAPLTSKIATAWQDPAIEARGDAIEARVARDVVAGLPDGATLVVASSLPVRALEWSMTPRAGIRVLANRGANGIDGFVSTVVGVAQANEPAATVGLC